MKKADYKKKFLTYSTVVLTVSLLFSIAFFVPLAYLDMQTSTNVAFKVDYLIDIIEFLQLAVSILAFAITYATLIYLFFSFEFKKIRLPIAIIMLMPIIKNATNLLSEWYRDGVPSSASARNTQLLSVGVEAGMEIIQHVIIVLIIYFVIKKAKKAQNVKKKALKRLKKEFEPNEDAFPLKSFYKKRNPIQKAAMLSSVVISVIRLLLRIEYDIFLGGVPEEATDLLWMVLYYLGDILVGIVCYLFMLLFLMGFNSHYKKLKDKYDKSGEKVEEK